MQSKSIAVVEVRKGFLSCQAVEDISAGSFLTDLWGPVLDSPNSHTVQIGSDKHVEPQGPLKCFNHSCQPNAKFIYTCHEDSNPDLDAKNEVFWYVVATRDIQKGADVTFDYNTSEYELVAVFQCQCGAEKCLGEIKGFKYLSSKQQEERMKDASPVIIDSWTKNLEE